MKNSLTDAIARDWAKEHTAHADDHGAEPWGIQWGGEGQTKAVMDLLKPYLKNRRILEIGCGGGKWTKALFDLAGAVEVTAIDVHDTAIEKAAEYEPRATYAKTDGETLPAGNYDVVFSWDVYLHLPTGAVLNYLQQASKIADTAIIQLPSLNNPLGQSSLLRLTAEKDYRKPFELGYMQFYSDETIELLLAYAGYEAVINLGAPNGRDTVCVGKHE